KEQNGWEKNHELCFVCRRLSESQFRHSLSRDDDIFSRKGTANASNSESPISPMGSHGNPSRETVFDIGSNTLPRGKMNVQRLFYRAKQHYRVQLQNESFVSNASEPSALCVFHLLVISKLSVVEFRRNTNELSSGSPERKWFTYGSEFYPVTRFSCKFVPVHRISVATSQATKLHKMFSLFVYLVCDEILQDRPSIWSKRATDTTTIVAVLPLVKIIS
ncbi:unnamed protein product, partial [Heterotrigona itama]